MRLLPSLFMCHARPLCASLGCLSESARPATPRGCMPLVQIASFISTPLVAEDCATGLMIVVVGMALTMVEAFFWRRLKLHTMMATQITKEGTPTATPTTTPVDTPEPPPPVIKFGLIDKVPSALTMTPGM